MKNILPLAFIAAVAFPIVAAESTDEIKAAAKKLADQPNYSWTSKTESPQARTDGGGQGGQGGGGRGRGGGFGGFGGAASGRTEKDGITYLSFNSRNNTTIDAFRKGEKVAVNVEDEWKTAAEIESDGDQGGGQAGGQGGGFNSPRFLIRRAQDAKLPSALGEELLGRVGNLRKDGDAYVGDLTPEGLKQMYTFPGPGGRRGAGGRGGTNNAAQGTSATAGAANPGRGGFRTPDTSGLKGTGKFWVKDGILTKFETHVEGKMAFGQDGQERDVNRTTILEIHDLGSTKVSVPAEAKKKLNKA